MIIAKLNLLTELPKTCAYCPYAIHAIGFIACDLVRVKGDIRTKLYGDITKRPDGCPLVEVESDWFYDILARIPDADVVEVVRCKDCRFHEDEQIGMVYCPATVGGWVEDNWFCKGGERRDE